ncbi:DNA polymerase delta, subunit 4 [Chytriomyces cf. hyalinus JEL632]|nr:DNA polymerase delta, subunit 4 [Chytriomyces cf. hyalinus JEL632]
MEVLRQFDLDMKFGPNVGLTRLARWERAQKFQLDPPSKVLEILNGHGRQSVTEIRESIWHEL